MKKLLILITILNVSYGKDVGCTNALNACNLVIAAQDKEIKDLKSERDTVVQDSKPFLPGWAYVAIGVLLGGTVVYELRK